MKQLGEMKKNAIEKVMAIISEYQGQQHGHRMKIQPLPHDQRLNHVADDQLYRARQCHDPDNRPSAVELDDSKRDWQQRGDYRSDRRNEVEQEGHDAEHQGQIQPEQPENQTHQQSGRG